MEAGPQNDVHDSVNDITYHKAPVEVGEPEERGWGWFVLLAAFFINLITDGCAYSFGVMYTHLLDYFGDSKSKTAWIGSLGYSVPLLCGPIASIITKRLGYRKATILGGVIAAVGFVTSAFATSTEVLCVTYGLIAGFGISLPYLNSIVVVVLYFNKRQALATGIAEAGAGIGTLIMAPLVEYLISEFGWRGTFVILGGIVSNVVVCGALFRPLANKKNLVKVENEYELLHSKDGFRIPHRPHSINEPSSQPSQLPYSIEEKSSQTFDLFNSLELSSQTPQFLNSVEEPSSQTPLLPEANNTCITQTIEKSEENPNNDNCTTTVQPPSRHASSEMCNVISNGDFRTLDVHQHTDNSLITKTVSNDDIYCTPDVESEQLGNIVAHPCCAVQCSPDVENEQLSNTVARPCCAVFSSFVDVTIFLNPVFVVYSVSTFLLYFWYDVPYVFLVDRTVSLGFTEKSSALIVSIVGIVHTAGNVLYGYAGDRAQINRTLLYCFSLMLCGLSNALIPLFRGYVPIAVLAACFGLFSASAEALCAVLIVDILGEERLSSAYSVIMFLQGVANLVGPPFAGWLFDVTGNYDSTFVAAGVGVIAAGGVYLCVPIVRKVRQSLQTRDALQSCFVSVDTAQ